MRRWCVVCCCCVSLLALAATPLFAQETTATVIGTVTDQSAAVLPGVVVVLRHVETGRTSERTTSAEGFYTAPLLTVGTYEITFRLAGFRTAWCAACRCRSTTIQVRAELINAFDQLQWLADPAVNGIDNTCTVSNTACNVPGDRFGQLIATRAPREIQLGLKLYW